MRMQRRSYGSRSGGGGIDWKRTIVYFAVFFIVISALHWLLGGSIFLIACLAIIAWHFLPGIIRNIKIKHRTKSAAKREPVDRTELLDLDD